MPDDVREMKAEIEHRRTAPTPFDIAIGGRLRRDDWEQERDYIRSIAGAGATWWMEGCPLDELEVMRARIKRGPLRIT